MADHSQALPRMADHVLAHGLAEATLRPLARAAGTSDRMLIYRYGSKDALIAAILDHLAERITTMLDAADLPATASPGALAHSVLSLMRTPDLRPYVAVWLEVAAGAARSQAGYAPAATRIVAHFKDWLRARLPPETPDPDAAATLLLATIEGALLIEAAAGPGFASAIDAALAGRQ